MLVPLLNPLPFPVPVVWLLPVLVPEPGPVGSSVLGPVLEILARLEELGLMREHLGAEAEARVGRRIRGRRGRRNRGTMDGIDVETR